MKQRLFVFFLSLVLGSLWSRTAAACEEGQNGGVTEYSHSIVINELLPDPEGDDEAGEFIELKNTGGESVDLVGWKITDTTQKLYTLPAGENISPGGVLVIERVKSGIALNNSGTEKAQLFWPDDKVASEASYENAPAGQAYARAVDGSWRWTKSVTKGAENIFTDTEEKTEPTDDPQEEPEPSQEETPDPAPKTYQLSSDIILNELLPDPDGSDEDGEWIELYNRSDKDVDLYLWKLTDKKTYYTFVESFVVRARDFAVIDRTSSEIALNNTGDEVFLIDPEDRIVNGAAYGKAASGVSFARKGATEEWQWSAEPTPGSENIFPEEQAEEISSESATTKEKEEEESKETEQGDTSFLPLATVYEQPKGAEVRVRGLVTVEPGVIDDKGIYITDNSRGIKVYFGREEWPAMKLGDRVEVLGKVSEAYGEKKINVAQKKDIVVKENAAAEIRPVDLSDSAITNEYFGQLVTLQATLNKQHKNDLEIFNEKGEEITVMLESKQLAIEQWPAGSKLVITGILRAATAGPKLYPRYQDDIRQVTLEDQRSEPVMGATATEDSMAPEDTSASLLPTAITDLPLPVQKASPSFFYLGLASAAVSLVFGFIVLEERLQLIRRLKDHQWFKKMKKY